MNRIYATTSLEISQREITNLSRSRRIAAEGMVLLKNNGILPMELKEEKLHYSETAQGIRCQAVQAPER